MRPAPLLAASVLLSMIAVSASADPLAATSFDRQLHQYFYVAFPQRLASINDQIALAESEVAQLESRVAQYRPMQSFRQYGATYLADQSAQLAVLAARLQLNNLRACKASLWHERALVAEQMLSVGR